jgi:signal transduction histidine kinase
MSKRPVRVPLHRGWGRRLAVTLGLLGYAASVYTVIVLGGGALTGHTDSPSLTLSILATVIIALSFARVQFRLERVAARAGLGGAMSPYDALSQFSEAVTSSVAPAETPARMARILAQGTGALWAQVWLVVDDELILVAVWPPGAAADLGAPASPPETARVTTGGERTLAVRHAADTLGVLRLQERPGLALTTVEERLFAGLAAQAGAVLRQTVLQAELVERHDELVAQSAALRASRERLVTTQDAERRRLERDMHDGAQQHLVALAVNLRLAQSLSPRSPVRASEILATQADASVVAINTLTTMSRGIYPRLLADHGLGPALQATLTASAVPVTVGAVDLGRLPSAVEAAFYFCALEAVQNATKHANADQVTVELGQDDHSWQLCVTDDGTGFDLADATHTAGGRGLLNLSDRLSAVGGNVRVTSTPGAGTRVTATVPRATAHARPVSALLGHGMLT